jgi:hypothetical protein
MFTFRRMRDGKKERLGSLTYAKIGKVQSSVILKGFCPGEGSLQMNWEKQALLGLGEGEDKTHPSQVICKCDCGE